MTLLKLMRLKLDQEKVTFSEGKCIIHIGAPRVQCLVFKSCRSRISANDTRIACFITWYPLISTANVVAERIHLPSVANKK